MRVLKKSTAKRNLGSVLCKFELEISYFDKLLDSANFCHRLSCFFSGFSCSSAVALPHTLRCPWFLAAELAVTRHARSCRKLVPWVYSSHYCSYFILKLCVLRFCQKSTDIIGFQTWPYLMIMIERGVGPGVTTGEDPREMGGVISPPIFDTAEGVIT